MTILQLKKEINRISKILFGNNYMPFTNKRNKFSKEWLEKEIEYLKELLPTGSKK